MSNRLPVRVEIEDGSIRTRPSSGGLASAVRGLQGESEFVWIGWPGCVVPEPMQAEVTARLAGDRLVPVFLSEDEERRYYHEYGNQVLWPLLHYFTGKLTPEPGSWSTVGSVQSGRCTGARLGFVRGVVLVA